MGRFLLLLVRKIPPADEPKGAPKFYKIWKAQITRGPNVRINSVTYVTTQAARMNLECYHTLLIDKSAARNWEENGQVLCTTPHLKKSAAEPPELLAPYE